VFRPRRIVLVAATIVLAVVLAVLAAAQLIMGGAGATGNGGATGVCDPAIAAKQGGGASIGGLNSGQITNARAIIAAGKAKNVPTQGVIVALAAAGQESVYRNLANPGVPESLSLPHQGSGSNADSLGLFQQRPSQGWGTPAQLMTPAYAASAFLAHLLKVAGWQDMPVTVAAQSVQRSGFPSAYAKWATLAGQLVAKLAGITDPSGCTNVAGQDLGGARQRIITAAESQLGLPYVWNAGDESGPTKSGSGCDPAAIGGCAAVGFDCSGLTLYAWAAAGIKLDHYAATQYTQGKQVPVVNAQPGDLLFWATNTSVVASIHHVAIYLGNNTMIEAPQSGEVVRKTSVRRDGELMPMAVQPTK
jgi:peptidoglycan DL-endopeptidase CwlO